MKAKLLLGIVMCVHGAFCAPVYKIEELCSFPPGAGTESGPWAGVTFGNDGAIYGTTYAGGAYGYGSVFRVTTNGSLTTLVSFANTNGASPRTLLFGPDGAIYGATALGGPQNAGTVFKLTSDGQLVTLVHFARTNGNGPVADMIVDSSSALYGTTAAGGAFDCGSVFRLTTNGVLTTLASFNRTNGNLPYSNLIAAEDGSFYGTTYYGDPFSGTYFGSGNVFRLSPDGALANLASFAYTNGDRPCGRLLLGPDGAIYGASQGNGIFRVTTNGALSFIAIFDPLSHPAIGTQPRGGIIRGTDGAFYGTCFSGGNWNTGTVFRVTLDGLVTTLAPFTGTNGAYPRATLVLGSTGELYGTTSTGGSLGGGNVFRLVVFSHLQSCERLGNACLVKFTGVEGETYRLERSSNLSGPWSTLTNLTLDATRQAQFLDAAAPATAAFYRTVTP